MIDVEEEDQAATSLQLESTELAKGCEDFVRTRDSLVSLPGLWVAHVAVLRSIVGHLSKRAIVT